jgi:hypothetical protein
VPSKAGRRQPECGLLPLEEVEDQRHAPGVDIRPLHPPLLRPMAVAHRRLPVPNPAVEAVLQVLAAFAS